MSMKIPKNVPSVSRVTNILLQLKILPSIADKNLCQLSSSFKGLSGWCLYHGGLLNTAYSFVLCDQIATQVRYF
jgi:hypothetical protein